MLLQENGDIVKLDISGRILIRCFTGLHQVEEREIAVVFKAVDFGCTGEDKHCCLHCLEKYNLERWLHPMLIKQWQAEARKEVRS